MTIARHDTYIHKSRPRSSLSDPGSFAGRWVNEYGSTMDLTVTGNQLTGSYTTAVSSTGQPLTAPLTGTVQGDLVSFTVNWTPLMSITAWVGQMVDEAAGTPRIVTLWQMTTEVPDDQEPTGLWTSILAGTDTFHR